MKKRFIVLFLVLIVLFCIKHFDSMSMRIMMYSRWKIYLPSIVEKEVYYDNITFDGDILVSVKLKRKNETTKFIKKNKLFLINDTNRKKMRQVIKYIDREGLTKEQKKNTKKVLKKLNSIIDSNHGYFLLKRKKNGDNLILIFDSQSSVVYIHQNLY